MDQHERRKMQESLSDSLLHGETFKGNLLCRAVITLLDEVGLLNVFLLSCEACGETATVYVADLQAGEPEEGWLTWSVKSRHLFCQTHARPSKRYDRDGVLMEPPPPPPKEPRQFSCRHVAGYTISHWPEYQALMKRLGVQDPLTVDLRIDAPLRDLHALPKEGP